MVCSALTWRCGWQRPKMPGSAPVEVGSKVAYGRVPRVRSSEEVVRFRPSMVAR